MSLPVPRDCASLKALVAEIGFLPLFRSSVPGFSAEDMAPGAPWYTGEESDPWAMRERLACDPDIVYGKLFAGKAGFCHMSAYGSLLNLRRDGYDFDTLVDEGVVSARQRALMAALFASSGPMFAFELKSAAGFGREGLKGFDAAIGELQGKCYLLVHGFARKRDRFGREYGWNVNVYDTPERRFGAEFIDRAYEEEPSASLSFLAERASRALPSINREALSRLLAGN